MPQHEVATHSQCGRDIIDSTTSQPWCIAGGEAGAEVRQELETKRDALVSNYVAKRDALVAEILPKVLF